jgi:hypothetical protein
MNTKAPISDNISPAVHLEFIQNQLENVGHSASEEIEQYHRALFLHHHSVQWEKHRQEARTHQDRVTFLESRLKETESELRSRKKLVPAKVDEREDVRPTSPWNAWDVAMFVACVAGILALMVFGVLNISFNLLESGFVTFRENPFRSYLWAALLPVGALAVKVGWDLLIEPRRRAFYTWCCLALGMLGVLVWVGAYAVVYPTLSKGVNEQIASLTVFDTPSASGTSGAGLNFAGAKWVDVVTVAAQAVAEIFLSAVLGMHLTNLYSRHRPVRLAVDRGFLQLNDERLELEDQLARERTRLGEATGNLLKLENQMAALIAYGKSLFHRETAKRKDQSQKRQVILSQLSDHLRSHLESPESNGRFAATLGETVGNGRNGG